MARLAIKFRSFFEKGNFIPRHNAPGWMRNKHVPVFRGHEAIQLEPSEETRTEQHTELTLREQQIRGGFYFKTLMVHTSYLCSIWLLLYATTITSYATK